MAASKYLRVLLLILMAAFCPLCMVGQERVGTNAVDTASMAEPIATLGADSALGMPLAVELPFQRVEDAAPAAKRYPLSTPFHPVMILLQCLGGAMSGAAFGSLGAVTLGLAGVAYGAVFGVPVGVLIAGANNGGPRGIGAYLVSVAGASLGWQLAIKDVHNLGTLAISVIGSSVLSYQLLGLLLRNSGSASTATTQLSEQVNDFSSQVAATRQRMLVPVDERWRCEVLSIRF